MSKIDNKVVDSRHLVDNQKLAEIGARMKKAREASGLSRPAFCEKFGGSVRTLENNEGGRNEPGAGMVSSFVSLGINANWLLTGEGPMLLADLVAPAPAAPPPTPMPAINADCLEAIIEGTLRVAPNAKPAALAAQITSVYKGFLDNGLITAEGKQASGNLSNAA